jgi:hypothetical protein
MGVTAGSVAQDRSRHQTLRSLNVRDRVWSNPGSPGHDKEHQRGKDKSGEPNAHKVRRISVGFHMALWEYRLRPGIVNGVRGRLSKPNGRYPDKVPTWIQSQGPDVSTSVVVSRSALSSCLFCLVRSSGKVNKSFPGFPTRAPDSKMARARAYPLAGGHAGLPGDHLWFA